MKIELNPRYEHLRPFIAQIPNVFDHEGREIYHLRNVIKVMTAPDGMLLNVKRYHIPHGPNRLIYSWNLRKPKGQRAFEYPAVLISKGICTPEPVALIEQRGALGLLGHTYFVSQQVDWGHTLYEMGNAQKGQYEDMAKALGAFAAEMHDKELLHKDFTPGNVLWRKDERGYHFCLVDINRMYFGPVSAKRGVLNLTRFWGPKAFIELLVAEYARQRGIEPEQAVAMALQARARFWRRYGRKHKLPFKLEL